MTGLGNSGPPPKHPSQRRRRSSSAATLRVLQARKGKIPALPGSGWSPFARGYWKTIWKSPVASVWIEVDVPALVRLTLLMQRYDEGAMTAALLSEIRQLEDRYGLSPLARRRLQWEVEQAAGAEVPSGRASRGDEERWLRVVGDEPAPGPRGSRKSQQ